jgi:hypothetical protein
MDEPALREALSSRALAARDRFGMPAIAQRWERLFADLGDFV